MAIGAFWFSLMGLFVKLAGRHLGSMEIVFARSVITLGLSWWSLWRLGISPLGNNRRLLFVRGLLGATALLFYFYSIVHLPLGEATLIQYTNPVFATVLAAVILRESLRAREIACLVASLLGVLFVARPPAALAANSPATNPLYIGAALVGAACSGSAYTLVRKMRGAEHPLVIVGYLPLLSVPLSMPFAIAQWQWPDASEWLLLIGVGCHDAAGADLDDAWASAGAHCPRDDGRLSAGRVRRFVGRHLPRRDPRRVDTRRGGDHHRVDAPPDVVEVG